MSVEPAMLENEVLRSLPPETAAASAAAEGVIQGMGEEMLASLLGEGGGLWVLSIVGVPMRAGFEKSFFFEDSFFSFPAERGVVSV